MATQAESLIVGLDLDADKYLSKAKQVDAANDSISRTSKKASSNVSGFGRSSGMAGIQVQQFVGQIQGGQNAMVALSQQSADLGFVLGAPLLGAVVGITASVIGMAIAFSDTGEKVEDFKFDIDDMTKSLEKLSELSRAQLRVGLLDTTKQLKQIEKQSEVTGNKIFALSEKLNAGARDSVTFSKTGEAIISTVALTAKETKKLNEELDKEKSNLDKLNKSKQDQLNIQNEINTVLDKRPSITEKEKAEKIAIDSTNKALREKIKANQELYNIAQVQDLAVPELAGAALLHEQRLRDEESFLEDIAEIKFTGLETVDELYFKELEIHKSMLENKLIGEEEFAKAQEKLSKQYSASKAGEAKTLKKVEKDKVGVQLSSVSSALSIANQAFEGNKAIRAGMIVADTASAITRQFADLPYPAAIGTSVLIAAAGAAQLSSALSATPGGGSISTSAGGAPPTQTAPDFEQETAGLELTTQDSSGGVTTQRIIISTDDGSDIFDGIAQGIQERTRQGA